MNNANLFLLFRITLILCFGYIGLYFLLLTPNWLVSFWFFLFSLICIVELVRFLERSKRDLATFLIGIKQKDFSNSYFKQSSSGADKQLYQAFSVITEEFKSLRKEKETNFHFLQAVVEHSGIPMIGYKVKNEQITLMNQAAKDLFNKPFITSLNMFGQIDFGLLATIKKLKSGEKELVKIVLKNQLLHLSVIAKELKLEDESYKLISFQNIKSELDEKELESWQKLIRVLTHEIKNSAIPISTLTEVINQMIIDENGNVKDLSLLDQEELEDIRLGMHTVEKRSKGLVKFVNAYGQLAKIPEPQLATIDVAKLIEQVVNLVRNDIKKSNIKLKVESSENLIISADPELLEQVLINLIKNAREALTDTKDPLIDISTYKQQNYVVIAVHDNGPGIPPNILENIFIPFYTTKKEGSGIGLSLSRQIMRAHKGTISVSSDASEGTTFYLRF